MHGRNCYEDEARAAAYARLEFPGTYYLAYRDLPLLFERHVRGDTALDFGCGTGRSTRFLAKHGFRALGVDQAAEMIASARALDPDGDYRQSGGEALASLVPERFALVLAAFTFDNIPLGDGKVALLDELGERLADEGRLINLVSSPLIYVNEWMSFSTRDYPENRDAGSGDSVRIVITDIDDSRPVEDVLCTEEDYLALYERAGLSRVEALHPLGSSGEPFAWVNEDRIAPWRIDVLASR